MKCSYARIRQHQTHNDNLLLVVKPDEIVRFVGREGGGGRM